MSSKKNRKIDLLIKVLSPAEGQGQQILRHKKKIIDL